MTISFRTIELIENWLRGTTAFTTAPGNGAFGITPSNTNTLVHQSRGIFIGTTGNLHVKMADGSDATFTNIQDGTFLPIAVTMVYADSTATDLTAVY